FDVQQLAADDFWPGLDLDDAVSARGAVAFERRAAGTASFVRRATPTDDGSQLVALLDVRKLTVRFGGLTAVDGFDCAVDSGKIFSVIGPNGAGKTTVFNAITGIYEPTDGDVLFAGKPLRRPFTARVIAICAIAGLLTGLGLALASVNVDKLWRAAIKRNYQGPKVPFPYRQAAHDALGYLNGELALEQVRGGRWSVVTPDGTRTLGYAETKEEAAELRDRLGGMIAQAGNSNSAGEQD